MPLQITSQQIHDELKGKTYLAIWLSDGLTNKEEPRSVKRYQILLRWRSEMLAGGAHQNSNCDPTVQFGYAGNG